MSMLENVAPSTAPAAPQPRAPRPWKFLGTSLWGLFIFSALFLGQIAVVGYLVLVHRGPVDMATLRSMLGGGITLPLSVMMGLPAVLGTIWIATHFARMPYAGYLGLRGTSWVTFLAGLGALIALVVGWDLLSRALGREVTSSFMVDVLRSAQADGALWLLVIAFCVAAPITEEFFVRGFLYRGWSESVLGPYGAIVLTSLVWTAMHLQYDWYFFGEIMTIGLLFGYLRYRTGSTWLTVALHALNNLAATLQTLWLAGHT